MNKNNHSKKHNFGMKDSGEINPKDFQGLFAKAQEIELTSAEKTKGYDAFHLFIAKNPPKPALSIHHYLVKLFISAKEKYTTLCAFTKQNHLAHAAMVACLILILLAAPAYAAQNALPGDVLYPIKIGINENIEAVIVFDKEEKARIAVKHALERAEEIELLAAQGRINAAREATAHARIAHDAKIAQQKIAQLKAQGEIDEAIRISSDYESKLIAHNKNIKDMEKNASDDAQVKLTEIRNNIRGYALASAKQRNMFEDSLDASSTIIIAKKTALGEFNNSEVKIKQAEQFVATPTLQAATRIQGIEEVRSKVETAKKTLEEAQEKLEVGAYDTALILFKNAQENVAAINDIIDYSKKP